MMENSAFAQHLLKLRSDVIVALQNAHPRGLTASEVKAKCPRARTIDEVAAALTVMFKRHEASRTQGADPVYGLLESPAQKSDVDDRKLPASSAPTVVVKALKKNAGKGAPRAGSLGDQILEYIAKCGPTSSPALVGIFGPSTYPCLSTLRSKNQIRCVEQRGNTKIWGLTNNIEPIDKPVELPTEVLEFQSELQITLLGDSEDDLLPETVFQGQASRLRIAHIVDAIEARARKGTSIPLEWPVELKRRLAEQFHTDSNDYQYSRSN